MKVAFIAGAAFGYVLGARAGRERYEQIRKTAKTVWGHPAVQSAAGKAREQANEVGTKAVHKAGEVSSEAAAKASEAARAARQRLHRDQEDPLMTM